MLTFGFILAGVVIWILYIVAKEKRDMEKRAEAMREMRYTRLGQIINESVDLFNNSKHMETRKSRIAVAIDHLEKILFEFPDHPDVERNKQLYDICIQSQHDIHFLQIGLNVEKVMLKSKVAKSHSSKVTNAVKALEYVENGFSNDFVDKDKLQTLKDSIEEYISELEINNFEMKAQKLEAKDKFQAAKDVYIDALFYIKNDSIPDAKQAEKIWELEKKIADLKKQ